MKISNYVVDTKNTMLPVNQIGILKIYYRIMCNSLFFSSGALKSIEKRSPNFFYYIHKFKRHISNECCVSGDFTSKFSLLTVPFFDGRLL